ncbi:MAG: MMPL family transporter [Planctomycetes bacterium]|nr:MMPL family transporter [Planctomycetota bacterium]
MAPNVVGRTWLVIVVAFLAAAAALGSFLPRLGVDASTSILLDEHDPDLTYYSQSRLLWPSDDEFAIVCCRRTDWFTPESVALLRKVQTDLEQTPHVKKVVSILSIPLLRQSPLPIPGRTVESKGVDLAKAKDELTHHAVARGTLISDDGTNAVFLAYLDQPAEYARLDREKTAAIVAKDEARAAAVAAPLESARGELSARRREMVGAIRALATKWTPEMTGPIRLSGLPIINLSLIEFVTHDVNWFGVGCIALFTLAFAAIYRKLRWTTLPIVACTLPVVLILGSMAALGQKLTVITANLPLLLFVMMLPYTVYFAERYRERRAQGSGESHTESTDGAVRDIWLPCLYSCTTTMAGFASLLTSGVKPVWWFGLMMTIGLAVGLGCAFLFLPAATRPLGAIEDARAKATPEPSGLVRWLERSVLGAPVAVVVVGAVLFVAAAWGCMKITVENKFIDYFWPRTEVYQGLDSIDKEMGGTTPMDIVLTSSEPGFFKTPKGVDAIRVAALWASSVPEVGSVTSLATIVAEAQKAPMLSKLTPDRVVAMAEANKDLAPLLRDVATADFKTARVLVRFRETAPTLHRQRILAAMRADLAARPELTDLAPRATGVFLLYANMLESLLASQKDTFAMVVASIYLMLLALFATVDLRRREAGASVARSFVHAALLSVVVLVPQVLPAVVVLGVMGWTGVPLDLITVTIAAIAMGVGIDAAIQYTVRYRIELDATGGDRRAAVTRSHATIGRSIWIATSIMVAGFVVLVVSDFVPTVMFGLFNALAMLMGQFAALTVLPALFLLTGLPRRTA